MDRYFKQVKPGRALRAKKLVSEPIPDEGTKVNQNVKNHDAKDVVDESVQGQKETKVNPKKNNTKQRAGVKSPNRVMDNYFKKTKPGRTTKVRKILNEHVLSEKGTQAVNVETKSLKHAANEEILGKEETKVDARSDNDVVHKEDNLVILERDASADIVEKHATNDEILGKEKTKVDVRSDNDVLHKENNLLILERDVSADVVEKHIINEEILGKEVTKVDVRSENDVVHEEDNSLILERDASADVVDESRFKVDQKKKDQLIPERHAIEEIQLEKVTKEKVKSNDTLSRHEQSTDNDSCKRSIPLQDILSILSQLKTNKVTEEEIGSIIATQGCNVNAETKTGLTALHLAAESGYRHVAETLLEHDADLHSLDEDLNTPLHTAVQNNNEEIVKILLKKGADVDVQQKIGRTSLHIATLHQNVRLIEILLTYGADIEVRDENGKTPLHYACDHSNRDADQVLSASVIMYKLLLHREKLKAAKLHVSSNVYETYVNTYKTKMKLKNYHNLCLKEIGELKKVMVSTRVSFYDLMHISARKIAKYTNTEFKRVLYAPSFKKKYPIYRDFIISACQTGIVRSRLLRAARNSMRKLTGINLPELCSDRIYSRLSNRNLHNLIQACNIEVESSE